MPLCRNRSDRCRMPHIRDALPRRKAFRRRSLCQCCGVKHLVLWFRGEPDICVSNIDGVALDIELLLFRRNLNVPKHGRSDWRAVKMHPLIVGVDGCSHLLTFRLSLPRVQLFEYAAGCEPSADFGGDERILILPCVPGSTSII